LTQGAAWRYRADMSTSLPPSGVLGTHEVTNQPLPPGDRDLWAGDPALAAAVQAGAGDVAALARQGKCLGTAEMAEAARLANRVLPELRQFDAGGRRLDEVVFHPAWHSFLSAGIGAGYAASAWDGTAGGHVTHAALVYLHSQVEPGSCCPMTMTHAAVPLLQEFRPDWAAGALSRVHDPTVRPAGQKAGLTVGMAMTEKQGGSDLRATMTRAERDGADWRLTGHKWFCSAPMSDGFLTLAQTPGGLTCFLLPRWLPEGRNAIRLMRLKDKLGNRSNASAEIEFERALAWQMGEVGRGIATILAMVHETRLDTAIAPAGIMQAALVGAIDWVRGRAAFGRRLVDQPLMQSVLADLALDREGAVALGIQTARAYVADPALARIGVALAKYLANKRCAAVVAEAMEALGGMGYIEDTGLPLLYREAPLNGIWEGSGNVICLDVLRSRERPECRAALEAALDSGMGADAAYDRARRAFASRWPDAVPESEARGYAEGAAILLTAAALMEVAPDAVAAGYAAARIAERSLTAGAVVPGDVAAILDRIAPPLS